MQVGHPVPVDERVHVLRAERRSLEASDAVRHPTDGLGLLVSQVTQPGRVTLRLNHEVAAVGSRTVEGMNVSHVDELVLEQDTTLGLVSLLVFLADEAVHAFSLTPDIANRREISPAPIAALHERQDVAERCVPVAGRVVRAPLRPARRGQALRGPPSVGGSRALHVRHGRRVHATGDVGRRVCQPSGVSTPNPERLNSGVHPDFLAEAHELGGRLRGRGDAVVQTVLMEHAQQAARDRDDNHVGTEHLVLALFRHGDNAAADVLAEFGISASSLEEVLEDEPGPSPEGLIPYTPRAVMIGGLSVAAADERGDERVEPLHLLIGVIAESARWERQHAWGPHHLRAAAVAAGSTLDDIEERATQRLSELPR